MNAIESLLLVLSNLLYYPVMLCLLLLACQQFMQLGRLLAEFKQRRSERFVLVQDFTTSVDGLNRLPDTTPQKQEMDLLLSLRKWELAYAQSMHLNSLVVKVGPALGLMGTLIPMGTALASLSEGDMMVMSVNMVTAFTTTVIGMAAGLSAYCIVHVRSNWKRTDTLACEAYCEELSLEVQ